VVVEDTGVGVPAERVPRLFTPFQQLDPMRSPAGTGLGLALARSLAEAMRGTLGYRPRTGGGSGFELVLPIELASERAAPFALPQLPRTSRAPSPVPSAPIGGARPRALVAEDDEVSRRLAVRMLERLGYEVTGVGDGERAIVEIATGHPRFGLVLLD